MFPTTYFNIHMLVFPFKYSIIYVAENMKIDKIRFKFKKVTFLVS